MKLSRTQLSNRRYRWLTVGTIGTVCCLVWLVTKEIPPAINKYQTTSQYIQKGEQQLAQAEKIPKAQREGQEFLMGVSHSTSWMKWKINGYKQDLISSTILSIAGILLSILMLGCIVALLFYLGLAY